VINLFLLSGCPAGEPQQTLSFDVQEFPVVWIRFLQEKMKSLIWRLVYLLFTYYLLHPIKKKFER
jgi:hypothetical protein